MRKDKRNEHFKKVHKNENDDLAAFDARIAEDIVNLQLAQEADGAFVNEMAS